VIFVGEELTVFHVVRGKYQKNFENHCSSHLWSYESQGVLFNCWIYFSAGFEFPIPRTVLFNLFVIVEPLIYFRVCHGTPLTKI